MIARALTFALCVAVLSGAASADNVITYHNSLTRNGDYEIPDLTLAAAANMHPDTAFNGTVSGNVYAQPLFWHPSGGNAEVVVATESNIVYALDAISGVVTWQSTLAPPVSLGQLPCGNINPDGITGTPVIDAKAGVLYLDALTNGKSGPQHLIYALSLTDGSIVSGWPLNVHQELRKLKIEFANSTQGERSALLFFGGSLYVNYSGNYGDCGSYRGSVVEVKPSTRKIAAAWQTEANGGGIWAQGGVCGDGKSVFATTGNTIGAAQWSGGEAIVRLKPGLGYSKNPKDFFAPSNWQTLDDEDLDLGGTEALPFDIAVSGGSPAKRVIAFGKDGNAYLADRDNLGGIGGALAVTNVSNSAIITAPAILSTQSGSMVAFTNSGGGNCSGGSVTMLNVAASGSSPITVAWCAALNGRGAPIITTTDGSSNAIVWAVGAEGDNELHGFNAQTGAVVFPGTGTAMSNLHHFVTIMAAEDHFYVASDNKIYAFAFQ